MSVTKTIKKKIAKRKQVFDYELWTQFVDGQDTKENRKKIIEAIKAHGGKKVKFKEKKGDVVFFEFNISVEEVMRQDLKMQQPLEIKKAVEALSCIGDHLVLLALKKNSIEYGIQIQL